MAVFYRDLNYSGNALALAPGSYPDLTIHSYNDKILSFTSNVNIFIILYEGLNFTGNFRLFKGPATISNLSDYGFNDKILSIKILNPPSGHGQIALHAISFENSPPIMFTMGEYPSLIEWNFHNQASSYAVQPHTLVVMYTSPNFKGNSITISNPTNNVSSANIPYPFDDNIESLKVIYL